MNLTRRLNSFEPHRFLLFIVGAFIVAAAVMAVPVYSVRSDSSPTKRSRDSKTSGAPTRQSRLNLLTASRSESLSSWSSNFRSLLPVPQATPDPIATYSATSVTNSGSAPLFGTIVGKTVTISNSGQLHYDTKLKTIWPDLWTLIVGP